MLTSTDIKTQAAALGFDVCGIAPAETHAELEALTGWLDKGYAGTMTYLHRSAERRSDVRRVLPSARTVIALATIYNTDRPYSVENPDPDVARISRYAWGDDYHTVLETRMTRLVEWMRDATDVPFEARAYVDTGPVQERVYAQHAGVGWIGKNTCLISPEVGSWLFLSEIICSLPLETDAPGLDQCGTCTLCLDACPTDALPEPWVLDATRCLSYLNIELKGPIPEPQREELGNHVYGCDICQDVCPWNASSVTSADPAWQPDPSLDRPRLAELWSRRDDVLRPVLAGSAMSRAGVRGLRRNVAVALGNSGSEEARTALADETEASADPIVAEHVAWARRRAGRWDP